VLNEEVYGGVHTNLLTITYWGAHELHFFQNAVWHALREEHLYLHVRFVHAMCSQEIVVFGCTKLEMNLIPCMMYDITVICFFSFYATRWALIE
jgi:hypothetical protein